MNSNPEMIVALYGTLRDTQSAMYALESAGVPYPTIRINNHSINDPDRPRLEAMTLPEPFWSLSVTLKASDPGQVTQVLKQHRPLAIGRMPAPQAGRDEVDQGAIAWRHYVFELPEVTPSLPESIGSSGTTGIISTGAFAEGAKAERDPLEDPPEP